MAEEKGLYYALEDKYYSLMEWIEGKLHIPVVRYFVDPIESRGIPSMPVFLLAVLLFAGVIAFIAFPFLSTAGLQTTILDVQVMANGAPLDGAQVTLLYNGEPFASAVSSDGVASFENVPVRGGYSVRVSAPGYAKFEKPVTLSSEPVSFTASLQSEGGAVIATPTPSGREYNFVVVVTDTAGKPVTNAVVDFSSPSPGGDSGSSTTNAQGEAVLKLSTQEQILLIDAHADGYLDERKAARAKDGGVKIELTSSGNAFFDSNGDNSGGASEGGQASFEGVDVLATIRDDAGNGVAVKCVLYDEQTSTPLDSAASDVGICSFKKAAQPGESVYVEVTPKDSSFLSKTSDSGIAQEGRLLEFKITLERATPPSTQEIRVSFKDEEGKPVSSASVNLYLLESNKLLGSSSTDENGLASFEVSSAIPLTSVYVTAYAEGFLPLSRELSGKDSSFVLQAAVTGNNADLAVRVKDDDGVLVSGATVVLLDGEGKILGMPAGTTDSAGIADFHGVPVGVELRARAASAPRFGESDVFSLSLGEEERTVDVFLAPARGSIRVFAEDLASGKPVAALKATAKLARDGTLEGSCVTDDNGSCIIQDVVAGKEVILVVSGPGYVEFTSSPFAVPANEIMEKKLKLLPSSLSNQTQVFLAEVRDEQGVDVTGAGVLSKAGYYWVRVVANFPKGVEEQGIMLRVGDKPTPAEEPAYIVSFDYAPVGVAAPVGFAGASYSPSGDSSSDLMNSDVSGGAKFVGVRFSGLAGSAELKARIFVKPTARPGIDKVKLYYRAWSRSGEVFSYEPADAVLGNSRKAADRDSLYAESRLASYDVVDGVLVCNDAGTACAALSFSSPENTVPSPSPFQAVLGRDFTVKYDLRVFGAFEASTAYARLWNPDETLKLKDFSGDGTSQKISDFEERVILSSAKQNYSGSFAVTPILPNQNARLAFEFGDGRGRILLSDANTVIVQGKGKLFITGLSPASLTAGKRKDLSLRVVSDLGVSIEDAKVALQEMDEAEAGSPFAGSPPSPLLGDASEDNGRDGFYRFSKLKPVAPGKFLVVVSREGFKEATAEVQVKTTDFFSFDPEDGIELDCRGGTLKVKNLLDANAPLDIVVGPGVDALPCVNVTGPGVVKKLERSPGAAAGSNKGHQYIPSGSSAGSFVEAVYHVENVKPGATKTLKLTPTSNGDCTIAFSSSDARSGSNYYSEYEVSNLCNAFNTSSVSQVLNVTGYVLRVQGNLWVGPDGKSGPARLLIPAPNDTRSGDNVSATVWFTNLDASAHSFYCQNRAKVRVLSVSAQQFPASSVVNYTFTRPGMYYCYLDNGDLAKIKVKSACPHHGVNYYAGFMAACLFKENLLKGTALGDIVNFGASAWEVAASIPIHYDLVTGTQTGVPNYPNPYLSTATVAQYGLPVCGIQGYPYANLPPNYAYNQQNNYFSPNGQPVTMPQGMPLSPLSTQCYGTGFYENINYAPPSTTTGADCKTVGNKMTCTVRISPMMRSGGVPFVLDNVILDQMPFLRVSKKIAGSGSNDCFQLWDLDNYYGTKIGEALGKGFFQVTGFGAYPLARSFAVVFNPDDKDSCINYVYKDGKLVVEPAGASEQEMKISTGIGRELRIVLKVLPLENDAMAPYYLTAVPAGGKVVARSYADKDYSVEPYLFVNNIPDRSVTFYYVDQNGNTVAETAGAPTKATEQSIVLFAPKIVDKQKTVVTKLKIGSAPEIRFDDKNNFVASDSPASFAVKAMDALKGTAVQNVTLLDVVGSVGAEDGLAPALKCSGTKFCTQEETEKAVKAITEAIQSAVKQSYSTMPFVLKRSFLDAQDLGFQNCLDALARELIADRASEAVCKNFFNLCNKDEFDAEEEEIEEGEAEGVSYSSVSAAAGGAIKQVICQGTQMGQQVQGIESIFGNAQARNLIRQAFGRALGSGTFTTPAPTQLLEKISLPEFYFMLKKADPLGGGVEGTGLKLFHLKVKSIDDLLAAASQQTGWETVYEEKGFVPGKPTEIQRIGSIPYRAAKSIIGGLYDWARDAVATSGKNRGFPYVVYDEKASAYTIGFSEYPTLATLNKFVVLPFLEPLEASGSPQLLDHDPLKIAEAFNKQRRTAPSTSAAATAVYVSSCFDSNVITDKSCLDSSGRLASAAPEVAEALGKKPDEILGVDGYFVVRVTGSDSWTSVPELKVVVREPAAPLDGKTASVAEEVQEIVKYFADEAYELKLPAGKEKWPCNATVVSASEIVGFCPGKVAVLQPQSITLSVVDEKGVPVKASKQGNCDYTVDLSDGLYKFVYFSVALGSQQATNQPVSLSFGKSTGPGTFVEVVDNFKLLQPNLAFPGISFGPASSEPNGRFRVLVTQKNPVQGKNYFTVQAFHKTSEGKQINSGKVTVCVTPATPAAAAPEQQARGIAREGTLGFVAVNTDQQDNPNLKGLPVPSTAVVKFNKAGDPSSGGKISIELGACSVDCGWTATLVQVPNANVYAGNYKWWWNNAAASFAHKGTKTTIVYEFPPFNELEGVPPKQGKGIPAADGVFFELFVCRDGFEPMLKKHNGQLSEDWNRDLWQNCRIAALPQIPREELWKPSTPSAQPSAPKPTPAATQAAATPTISPATQAKKLRGETCAQDSDCVPGSYCRVAGANQDFTSFLYPDEIMPVRDGMKYCVELGVAEKGEECILVNGSESECVQGLTCKRDASETTRVKYSCQ
ncbi:MAG: MSCRAMM family protein [Candidatus Micrarchaeia archaeon]